MLSHLTYNDVPRGRGESRSGGNSSEGKDDLVHGCGGWLYERVVGECSTVLVAAEGGRGVVAGRFAWVRQWLDRMEDVQTWRRHAPCPCIRHRAMNDECLSLSLLEDIFQLARTVDTHELPLHRIQHQHKRCDGTAKNNVGAPSMIWALNLNSSKGL